MAMGRNILLALLCCLIWSILLESFQFLTVAMGLGIGAAVVIITHRFIAAPGAQQEGALAPWRGLWYGLYLLFSIYRAGFKLFPAILRGRCPIGVYPIKTTLRSHLSRAVLANSITMTPGTVTVDMEGDTLTVLWLHEPGQEAEEAARQIAGGFEDRLMPGRRKP